MIASCITLRYQTTARKGRRVQNVHTKKRLRIMGKVFDSKRTEEDYRSQIDDIRCEMHEKTEQGLRLVELLSEKKNQIVNLTNALNKAEQLLRKAQRSIMYDEIQDYFKDPKKVW